MKKGYILKEEEHIFRKICSKSIPKSSFYYSKIKFIYVIKILSTVKVFQNQVFTVFISKCEPSTNIVAVEIFCEKYKIFDKF